MKLLEGRSVGHTQVPSVPCGGPKGSKLGRVASAMAAHEEVEADKSPIQPYSVGQLIAGYEAHNFFTVRHVTTARSLWLTGIRAGDCGPDAEGLLG